MLSGSAALQLTCPHLHTHQAQAHHPHPHGTAPWPWLPTRGGFQHRRVLRGAWRVMGSVSVSSPSRCIPAADAKFCFSHSPLVSAVDGEMPGLSCPGQRGRDLLLGSVSVSQTEPWAVAGSEAWLVQKEREDQHSRAHGTTELRAAVLPEGRQHGWLRAASVIPAQCRLGTHLASWI